MIFATICGINNPNRHYHYEYNYMEKSDCDNVCRKNNSIWIKGGISNDTENMFWNYANKISERSYDSVYIYIDSYGGDCDASLGIAYRIKYFRNQGILTVCFAGNSVMSGAIFPYTTCDIRYSRNNSLFLIHPAYYAKPDKDNKLDQLKLINLNNHLFSLIYINSIYFFPQNCPNCFIENANIFYKKLRKIYQTEEITNPYEMVLLGLVDYVI
jgi:hypothetical protein